MTENLDTEPGLVLPTDRDHTSPLDDADMFSQTTVLDNDAALRAAPDQRLQPGSVLRDRYLLHARVAAGSMGVVYKAFDRHLADADGTDSAVAIKVLSPELSNNKDALRALQQEAAKGRCLSHPNIVRFIDLDREDDLYFLVMEWLEGDSLAHALDTGTFRPDVAAAIAVVRQIGDALTYAHRCGVVHADVKPGNIMLLPDGTVKLVDFGIARVRQRRRDASVSDPDILRSATPAYSSMQVLTGDEPSTADDVFSLACLAYRLIAGHRVYGPRNAAEAAEAAMEPQRPQGLTDSQWRALRKGLGYARVARQKSPAEFVDDLVRQDSTHGVTADDSLRIPVDALLERRFASPRSRWPYVILLLLIAVAAGFVLRPDWRLAVAEWTQPVLLWGEDQVSSTRQGSAGTMSNRTDPAAALPDLSAGDAGAAPPQRGEETPVAAAESDRAVQPPAPPVENEHSEAASVDLSADGDVTSVDAQSLNAAPQGAGVNVDAEDDDTELLSATATAEGNNLVLAAPGEALGELIINLAEDGDDAVIDLYRWFGLSNALLVRIDEVGFSGSRSPGEDGKYTLSGEGIVSFDPGQSHAVVSISPSVNDLREPDRQVSLLLRDYYNPESTLARIELRLLDDDQRRFEEGIPVNTVAFATSRVIVSERDPAVQIDVERFNPDQSTLSVRYSITDITAVEGEDYFVPGRPFITFGPGQRSARLLIPLVQDNVTEGDESFVIEINQAATDSNTNNRVVVTIRDDDSDPN